MRYSCVYGAKNLVENNHHHRMINSLYNWVFVVFFLFRWKNG